MARLSEQPAFSQKGLKGYAYPLKNKNVEIYYVDVTQGHDNYIISKICTHIYYVLEGEGVFELDGKKTNMKKGELIEIPPNVEYAYSGNMRLLLIMNPPWFEGNEEIIRKNPSVK